MPDWITQLIMGPCYTIGWAIWQFAMSMITGVMTTTPESFSAEAWNFVTGTLYPWALGIGVLLLNLFFLIGFFRAASDLRQNFTMEILIMYGIKAVLANTLMHTGLTIMRDFFSMASALAGQVMSFEMPSFAPADVDFGTYLFFFIAGVLYVLVAVVCAILMFLTVYGRYLKLYVMVVFAPIALSTWAGGRGIENSAYAWIRSFLVNVFEVVVVALVLSIGGRLINSIDFGTFVDGLGQFVDGFGAVLQSMFVMIMMTAAVKGADSQLKRSFGL